MQLQPELVWSEAKLPCNKPGKSDVYKRQDVESTLQDLTDRYNKAYEDAIANGTGWEIKFDNYDPMNPTLE